MEKNLIIREDIGNIAVADLPWDRLRNKTVLITGGGGFLAAYLIKTLLVAGLQHSLNIRVICVARSVKSVTTRLAGCIDTTNFVVLEHDISKPLPNDFERADFVIHAASQASPKYYGADPVGTLSANSTGTMYLLEYAIRSQAERFMFFSSGEVYGVPIDCRQLIKEEDFGYLDPMDVRSCYAESKRIGETMCASWAKQHSLHTTVVRPFHTYGPGMALDDGRVFADFVADVVANRDIILKSDGLAKRPFCYIADATIGFFTILFHGEKGQAYNLGNPDAEISIYELAILISGLFPERGVSIRFEIPQVSSDSYLKSPIARACPDITKIKNLGWIPATTLKDGFRKTIQSFL